MKKKPKRRKQYQKKVPLYRYRCLNCGATFELPIRVDLPEGCPRCGNLYFDWENYEDFGISPRGYPLEEIV
jgi:predicted  nucleic acid-binding Zn-ribbon protein